MPLIEDLVSYWALDAASGTRVDKVTASGNDLTDNNTVTQAAGLVYANAARFTAADDEYLSRVDNASLSVGGTAFTIIAWVYIETNTGNAVMVAKDDSDVNREYVLYSDGTNFVFNTWTGASSAGAALVTATTFGTVATGTWYMVAAVADQSTIKISVNAGVLDSLAAVNAGWNGAATFTQGVNFSAGIPANGLDGRLGPVMFWKCVLLPSEITSIYNGGSGLTYEAILAMNRRWILSR